MKKLRMLLIDDDPNDRALALRELQKEFKVNVTEVKDAPGLTRAIKKFDFDVVLTDYQLGWTTGIKVLTAIKSRYPDCPVIMYTGSGDQEIAVEAMKAGLDDYIVKSRKNYRMLPTTIKAAIEHKRTEMALNASEEKYQKIFSNVNDMIIYVNKYGKILDVNEKIKDIFGFDREEVIGKNFMKIGAVRLRDLPKMIKLFRHAGKVGKIKDTTSKDINLMEWEIKRKNGDKAFIETTTTAVKKDGKLEGFLTVVRDITERKQVEEALKESEEKYREIVEMAPDGILTVDLAGIITSCNSAFLKLMGYLKKDIVGKHFLKLPMSFKEDLPEYKKLFRKVISGKTIRPIEFKMKHKDSTIHICEAHAAPMKKGGSFSNIQVIIRDITERKRAEGSLYESEEKYRRLVDNLFDTVLEVDKGGNFTYASPQITDIFGFKPEEVIGRNAFEFMHPDDIENAREVMAEALKREKLVRVEYRTLHKDGHYIPIYGSAKIIGEGDDLKIISVVRDITERKLAEDELDKYREHLEELVKQRTQQLEDTNAELETFAYSVSHDLRAPLRGMQGFAQALLEDYGTKLDADGKEYAERIIDSSKHMNLIIEDLLAYSRLSRAEIGLKSISLDSIIEEVTQQLGHRIHEKSAKVTVEPSLPAVNAHSTTLQKVIYNLILNAITFVEENVKPKIKIWTVEHKGKIRLYVKDNGIGIASEYHEKVFGIFERLHGIESYPGTGIGLAIVKKGIERMDGGVGVESELGKGSAFWVELNKGGINK